MREPDAKLVVVVRQAGIADAGSRGAARVEFLRVLALQALAEAARIRGAKLGKLEKDARDAPLPSGGWHWSISHTSLGNLGLVAASVSSEPVGVDAEAIGSARPELAQEVLRPEERALFRGVDDATAFTRAWTAKEAVLKKLGFGLTALSRARLEDVAGELCVVTLDDTRHAVESRAFAPFLVAVTGRARECVDWRGSDALQREVAP